MREHVARDLAELHAIFSEYRTDKRIVFRGQADSTWPLSPKAGRQEHSRVPDSEVFRSWKRWARAYMTTPPLSDWDWLAIAQNHGLATRLLDWSHNPLTATFFAVSSSHECERAAVWVAKFEREIDVDAVEPMDYRGLARFKPSAVVPRIVHQRGCFSVHGRPTESIAESTAGIALLERVTIDKRHWRKLLSELSYYGVNRAMLFPDLDGLSDFANWAVASGEFWELYEAAPKSETNPRQSG